VRAPGPRLPPGQSLTTKFPVLSYGPPPRFDRASWDFRLFGLVEEERRLSYDEFRALPNVRLTSDFHCVTTWSRFDNHWEGVRARDVVALVRLRPEARFAIVHCDQGYTTNLALADLVEPEVLFAWGHDGTELSPDHGYPLRLVVPTLYAWKSAKWVRGVEFLAEDQRGFWELRGYHNHADPWREERYSDQE
jgi:DMSO/TMAO reductase YedYZ molybdopterin-dependent catalytic subunit